VTSRDEDQQLRSIFRALGVVDEWESLTGGSVPSGKWRYYDGMLYTLALLHLSGNFRIYPPT